MADNYFVVIGTMKPQDIGKIAKNACLSRDQACNRAAELSAGCNKQVNVFKVGKHNLPEHFAKYQKGNKI